MANYCCAVRTNYFRVKDAGKFRTFFENVAGCEDSVKLWEEKADDGSVLFGFGCYGGIFGIRDDEDEDADYDVAYDDFIDGLQKHVAEDDAVIILEAGNEKLCYLTGHATIITSDTVAGADMISAAIEIARKNLGNKEYTTRTEY